MTHLLRVAVVPQQVADAVVNEDILHAYVEKLHVETRDRNRTHIDIEYVDDELMIKVTREGQPTECVYSELP